MKKSIIGLLMISICFSLTACSKNTLGDTANISTKSSESESNTNSATNNKDSSSVNSSTSDDNSKVLNDTNMPANTGTNTTNTKQYYLQKLDNIEKSLSDLDDLKAGNNSDMKQAAGEEYKRWDDALNEIYSAIKAKLSDNEIKDLEKDELKWIEYKEKKAAEDAKEFEGGTIESLIYSSSLASSTKDRCYYLVNTYCN